MQALLAASRVSVVLFVLCGLLYPLALTGIGQLILPFQANGSLQQSDEGTVIGSRLIGQQWDGPQWFHGRPSATTDTDPNDPGTTISAPYNAANSGGSNLGPTSQALLDRLLKDRKTLEAAEPQFVGQRLPADMLTTSASGLDPDISPANAALQVPRIAQARGLPSSQIHSLVDEHVTGRMLGIFGEPRVNVLALNLALDRACGATNAACKTAATRGVGQREPPVQR
ncbi:MAG: potassium-transporting ATPase subunit KdpC [Xanthobacteraceae bacterium]|nr:potassium-transporting ATPase subunit KdpC [Xanthobacteraceae bacterium]